LKGEKMKKAVFVTFAVVLLAVSYSSMQSGVNSKLAQLRAENPDVYIGKDSDGSYLKVIFYLNDIYKVFGWWDKEGVWVDHSKENIIGTYRLDGNTAVIRKSPRGLSTSLLKGGLRVELYETALIALKNAVNEKEYVYKPTETRKAEFKIIEYAGAKCAYRTVLLGITTA
jgi:hypothetical protein